MGNIKYLSLSLFILLPSLLFAQVNLEWLAIYDNINWEDSPTDFSVDRNGDIVVTGSSERSINPQSDYDYATVKFNKNGQLLWVSRYNYGGSDFASAIVQDDSLNSYVTGIASTCTTIKYDSNGTLKWKSTLHSYCNGKDIVLDDSGNVFILGTNEYSSYLFIQRLNKNGSEVWYKEFDEFGYSSADEIIYFGNNLYIRGNSYDTGNGQKGFIFASDLNGQSLWKNMINSKEIRSSQFNGMTLDMDNNLIITGSVQDTTYNTMVITLKIDLENNIIWNHFFDKNIYPDEGTKVAVDDNNNIVVGGYSESLDTNTYVFTEHLALIKYSADGEVLWSLPDNNPNYDEKIEFLDFDSESNIYCYGERITSGIINLLLKKYSPEGEFEYEIFYPHSMPVKLKVLDKDKFLLLARGSINTINPFDYYLLKYSRLTDVKYEDKSEDFNLFQNYPNPFNPATKIRYSISNNGTQFVQLKIYDILGTEVSTLVNQEQPAGNYEVNFNGEHLSSGVYLYRLNAGNYNSVKKMVLLK